MATRKIKSKKFKLKQQASDWAKKEKKKLGPQAGVKWETNKITGNSPMGWEAVIYKEV